MKLSEIDLTVCLGVDRREQDIKHVINVCKIIGLPCKMFIGGNGSNLNLKYDFIDRLDKQPRHNQCFFHKQVIEWVYEQKPKNCLFLEDDITLTRDFWEILNNVEVPLMWDQINIGGFCDNRQLYNRYDGNKDNPYLLESNSLGGFFGAFINSDSIKYLVEIGNEKRFVEGIGAGNDLIGKDKTDRFKRFILQPPVVIERNIISTIWNQWYPRGIFEQACREGRTFTDEEVMNIL